VIPHPTDLFNLALIIGLAAAALLLLLLVALFVLLVAMRRRRRRGKATDSGVDQALSSSTVSINLTPSTSSCSRSSEESIDMIGGETPPPPPLPPLPPPPPPSLRIPPLPPMTTVCDQPDPEVMAQPNDDVSGSGAEPIVPAKAYGVGVGVGVGAGASRTSWTQSLPHVAVSSSFSAADLRKAPPLVAKKTAKAQAVARHNQARRFSEDSVDTMEINVTRSSADPLPGLGPERPRPVGPSGHRVYIPPKLHREPRGWAPASHAVPAPVKRTWGRAKAKLEAERERAAADGANPSVSMFNISTIDDDNNDVGSTMSLNI